MPELVPQQQAESLTPEVIRRNVSATPARMVNIEIPEEHVGAWEKFKRFFVGSKGKNILSPLYTEPQMQGFDFARNLGLQQLQNPYQGFQPIDEYARKQFYGQTVPTIAERFTAMGDSAQRSSAFPAALGAAGTDLEARLGALRAQYGLQQQGLGQSLLGLGLTSQYQPVYFPGTPGIGQKLIGGGLGALGGAGVGFLAGGPGGAALGALSGGAAGLAGS